MDLDKDSEILKALGHPIRLKIVMGLMEKNNCNVNTIVDNLGIPQSTASQHLSVLKNRGILSFHKKGVEACYYIADERVKAIIDCLK